MFQEQTLSQNSMKFYLKGKNFHLLETLKTSNSKIFPIKVVNKTFSFTKEQYFLLSPTVYDSINQGSFPFIIPLPYDQSISFEQLQTCFEHLVSLFSTQTQLKINLSNVDVYQYLSNVLDNPFIASICQNLSFSENNIFQFNSKMFLNVSKEIRESLNDFNVFLDNHQIHCNKCFSCCLSKSIYDAVLQDQSLTEFHFHLNVADIIFQSIFNILFGYTFKIKNVSQQNLLKCFCLVGCPFEIKYEIEHFKELISFLSLPYCQLQKNFIKNPLKMLLLTLIK
jgi:hypothetical protein